MFCSFCRNPVSVPEALCIRSFILCPHCLEQLTSVSAADQTYDWYISAVRRALTA